MERIWPDTELEKQMLSDAENPACNSDGTDRDVVCHVKSLLCRVRELEDRCEQYEVQLAGVLAAAEGAVSEPVVAKNGDYGWSFAYQRVLELRRMFNEYAPFNALTFDQCNMHHMPLDIMANPPPNDLMTSALIRHIGQKIDARYVGNEHDAEIIKAAADNPIPFTIVAQTNNMAVVKVDGTEAVMVFGTEEIEP